MAGINNVENGTLILADTIRNNFDINEILKLKNLILREYTEINISDNPLKTERFRHIDENESYKKIYEYLSVMILLYNNLTH